MVNLRVYLLIILYIVLLNANISHILITTSENSVYAHNDSNISVPIAKQKIYLDGQLDEEEWKDAFKINFTSPSTGEGSIVIFLKYELTENSLNGAFMIPDRTPIDIAESPDQIGFLFDVPHSALNTTTSDNQMIIFIRNGVSEYYKGIDRTDSDSIFAGEKSLALVNNATMASSDNANYSFLGLDNPFSGADYGIISNDGSWQGEFKIYFMQNPQTMGFAIQQQDWHVTSQGIPERFFINFPMNFTQANIPSSWGDISFFELGRYVEYIEDFCPNTRPYISSDSIAILCSSLNVQSVEENDEGDVVFATGTYANLINGTGISGNLEISLKDPEGNLLRTTLPVTIRSTDNGTFESDVLDTVGLPSGTYRVEVQPQPLEHQGLISSTDLIVNPKPVTFEETVTQLGTYIGVAAAVVGLIALLPQVRNYISGKKQRHNMAKEVNDLNRIHDRIFARTLQVLNSKEALASLAKKRDDVLTLFKNNELSQEQYSWLDGRITEYMNRFR